MTPRTRCSLSLAATVALGLASRAIPLPGWFAEHTGDALYTAAAYWALATLWPAARKVHLATAAWTISALVECSQRLDWAWLGALRATRIGALLLGQGFQWADLVAYSLGAALVLAFDALTRRPRDKS